MQEGASRESWGWGGHKNKRLCIEVLHGRAEVERRGTDGRRRALERFWERYWEGVLGRGGKEQGH